MTVDKTFVTKLDDIARSGSRRRGAKSLGGWAFSKICSILQR